MLIKKLYNLGHKYPKLYNLYYFINFKPSKIYLKMHFGYIQSAFL